MSGEHQAFADWLKARAAAAGYDLDKRGTISRLAEESGVDPAQMSRFLRGQAIPAIEGQRGIAKALDIFLPEVMINAGVAVPGDFDDDEPRRPLTLQEAVNRMGLDAAERELLVRSAAPIVELIEQLRSHRLAIQRGTESAKPSPRAVPETEEPGIDPLVMDTLSSVVRNRRRRLLAGDPPAGDTPAGVEEQPTRGIGWLPAETPPVPTGDSERWFAPKPPEE